MRVISIAGTYSSGKTTTIKALMTHFAARGKSCSVIVNEDGKAGYEDGDINGRQISVEYLRGG